MDESLAEALELRRETEAMFAVEEPPWPSEPLLFPLLRHTPSTKKEFS